MKKILGFLIFSFSACGPVFADATKFQAEEVETPYINLRADLNADGSGFVPEPSTFEVVQNRSIVYNAGKRWTDTSNVPVCWINPEEAGEIVGDLQNHLSNEYRRANLMFRYEGKCNDDSYKSTKIRVWFKRTHDWANESSISAGAGLSFVGAENGRLGGNEGQGTMNIQISRNVLGYAKNRWADFTKNVTRATAVHEFGHAFGLAHEQSRDDAPACNDQRGDLKNDGRYVFVGAYDQYSIMNYCRNGANVSSLSEGDIQGLRYLYPNAGNGGGGGSSDNPPSGSYEIRNVHSDKCVDLNSSGSSNGTKVQNWSCNNTQAQSFWIVNYNGWVMFKNTKNNKCIDVPSSSKNNGAKLQLYDCNNTDAQLWQFDERKNGYAARIRNKSSGKCLDLTDWNKADGTHLQQWDCGEGDNQLFRLLKK